MYKREYKNHFLYLHVFFSSVAVKLKFIYFIQKFVYSPERKKKRAYIRKQEIIKDTFIAFIHSIKYAK